MNCIGYGKRGRNCRRTPLKGKVYCRQHLNEAINRATPSAGQAWVCREAGVDPRFRTPLNLAAISKFLDSLSPEERVVLARVGVSEVGMGNWLKTLNDFGDVCPVEATELWDEKVLGGTWELDAFVKAVQQTEYERCLRTMNGYASRGVGWDTAQHGVAAAMQVGLPVGASLPTEDDYDKLVEEWRSYHDKRQAHEDKRQAQDLKIRKEMQAKWATWSKSNPMPQPPEWD